MARSIFLEDLVSLAREAGVTNVDGHVRAIEGAIDCFAEHVARHFKVETAMSVSITDGERSVIDFTAAKEGQRCPKPLKDADPDGSWP